MFKQDADHGYGKAMTDMIRVNGERAHLLTVKPVVKSLSSFESGVLGGQELELTGTGFHADEGKDCSANQVTLANIPCKVTQCTRTSIRCTVGERNATSSSPHAGTSGLVAMRWKGTAASLDNWDATATYGMPDEGPFHTMGGTRGRGAFDTSTANNREEQNGYFVAPHTAKYSFWLAGDDKAALFLNTKTSDFGSMAKVVEVKTASHLYQKSAPVQLTAGQRYPLRTRHIGSGSQFMLAGVEILDGPPGGELVQQYHRVHEIQRVTLEAKRVRQVQKVTITEAGGGTLQFIGTEVDKVTRKTKMSALVSIRASDRQGQFTSALRSVYTACRSISVAVDDKLDTMATLTFSVSFDCDAGLDETGAAKLFPNILVSGKDLTSKVGRRSARSLPQISVKTTQRPSASLSGVFKLVMGTRSTAAMTTDLEGEEVGQFITKFLPVQVARVTTKTGVRTVGADSIQYVEHEITFLAPYGQNFPQIKPDATKLTGTDKRMAVKTLQEGKPDSRVFLPIPDTMLEVAESTTSAVLHVNGINAVCKSSTATGCTFQYNAALTPQITGLSGQSGKQSVVEGEILTISGSNLRYKGGGVAVTFGRAECVVQSHSESSITCKVAHSMHGLYHPVVVVEKIGTASFDANVQKLKYQGVISSVFPVLSGVRGGTTVTFTGTGFSKDGLENKITIGGLPCKVTAAAHDTVECTAPALNDKTLNSMKFGGELVTTTTAAVAGNTTGNNTDGSGPSPTAAPANLPATFEGDVLVDLFESGSAWGTAFTFSWALTPSMVFIDPVEISSAVTQHVTASIADMASFSTSSNKGCAAALDFVSPSGVVRPCIKLTLNGTQASCTVVRAAPLPLADQQYMFPRLQLCTGAGHTVISHPEPAFTAVDIALRVESVSPALGSVAGGTLVTIRGAGFVDESKKIVRSALTYNYLDAMVVANITLADRSIGCQIQKSGFNYIHCLTVMPEAADAKFTTASKHTYTGGYNGKFDVHVNDFVVPGCGAPEAFGPGAGSNGGDQVIDWGLTTSGAAANLTVKKGAKITWRFNLDKQPHSVVSGPPGKPDGNFASPLLGAGKSWSRTFDTAGTFAYYCGPHAFMAGTITVVENLQAASNQTTTTETTAHKFKTDSTGYVCQFDYGTTAALSGVSPTEGRGATELTIAGAGFNSKPVVTVGPHSCVVSSYTASSVTCNAPAMAAGDYNIRVSLASGYAAHPRSPIQFKSMFSVQSIMPKSSSMMGGVVLTVRGHGFPESAIGAGNTISIAGKQAHIIQSNDTHIIAVSPPKANEGATNVEVKIEAFSAPDYYYGQTTPVYRGNNGGDQVIDWGLDTSGAAASKTIKKGTKITWRLNLDKQPHSVISGPPGKRDGNFASKMLAAGESWSRTFDTAGTFAYYCDPHAFMAGTQQITRYNIARLRLFEMVRNILIRDVVCT